MKTKTKISILFLTVLLGIGSLVIAKTSTFTPSTTNATMVTLEDIYQKMQDFTEYDLSSHTLTTSDVPAGTMHTLQDIWDALSGNSIDSGSILEGTTIMGVAGSAPVGGGSLSWSVTQPDNTWDNAKNICEGVEGYLNSSGAYFSNCRLPTIGELAEIMMDKKYADSQSQEYGVAGLYDQKYFWAGDYLNPDNGNIIKIVDGGLSYEPVSKNWSYSFKCVCEI